MNELRLRLLNASAVHSPPAHTPLGELLVGTGKIAPAALAHALKLQGSIDAPLGDIMVAEGLVERSDVLIALASQSRGQCEDLERDPPLPEMADCLSAELCLRHRILPWKEDTHAIYVATPNPQAFNALRAEIGPTTKPLFPVIVEEAQIQANICRLHGVEVAQKAERRVPAAESCRDWEGLSGVRSRWALASVTGFVGATLAAPAVMISILSVLAVITLFMTTVLKLTALIAHLMPVTAIKRLRVASVLQALKNRPPKPTTPIKEPELVLLTGARASAALGLAQAAEGFSGGALPIINAGDGRFRLPRVSVLVPLLREREIAGQLIKRLSGLTYPKSLLEVVLVLEESDTLTRETIARTDLPDWMRVIEVPATGDLTTKPRALNYALEFCKGSIIGVWDAEDWPEADQIERVVNRFQKAPPETACLQGILDYYNSRTNFLTHCFSIEYAAWWRVFLPGIARMGLVVPLGGTTLFFRRAALEKLGAWDAHNVTEDADLGLRLARHGYVTELLPTVTHEEATSRAWPWVRQRSRWLKGFLVTYCVHMRRPRALLRDLGFARFMGVQTLFLATGMQFALAPVLWSFWLILFGVHHPVTDVLGTGTVWAMIGLFITSALISISAGFVAVSRRTHRHLIPFLPVMGLYFTLGTLAALKAIWELVRAPFYWDKTQHGVSRQIDYTP